MDQQRSRRDQGLRYVREGRTYLHSSNPPEAAGKNKALVVQLLGHTPNWISSEYGAVPWSELAKAVELL